MTATPHETDETAPLNDAPPRECQGCPQSHACRDVWSAKNTGPLAPVGLTLGSATAFLFPLLTAIVAGALARHWGSDGETPEPALEALAALGGLAVGVLLAWWVMPRIKRRYPAESDTCSQTK